MHPTCTVNSRGHLWPSGVTGTSWARGSSSGLVRGLLLREQDETSTSKYRNETNRAYAYPYGKHTARHKPVKMRPS